MRLKSGLFYFVQSPDIMVVGSYASGYTVGVLWTNAGREFGGAELRAPGCHSGCWMMLRGDAV